MTNLGILDLVLGLFFIYFVFSVICTSFVELIAQMRNLRAKSLNKWIRDTFNNEAMVDGLGDKLIKHGLVDGLTMKGRFASFIPAKVFTSALFDLLHQHAASKTTNELVPNIFDCASLKSAIEQSEEFLPKDIQRFMLQAINECKELEGGMEKMTEKMNHWYEDAMDRLIGTYKKKTRLITFVIAAILTVSLNINTIEITKYLKDNPQKAQLLAAAAQNAARDSVLYKQTLVKLDSIDRKLNTKADSTTAASLSESIALLTAAKHQTDSIYTSVKEAGIPLGWSSTTIDLTYKGNPDSGMDKFFFYLKIFLTVLGGWLATIAALSLGAPFWFDLMNKVANVRSAGNIPASTKKAK